jgi:hypothetical protein
MKTAMKPKKTKTEYALPLPARKSDVFRNSDKGHQVYRLQDGTRVPGATTITGVLNKPALVVWANRMGLQNIDTTKYVDSLAAAGTLAHYLAACELLGEPPDQGYLDEFSKVDHDRATNAMLSFYNWQKQHAVEVIASEQQLVSEQYRFGGTCDFIATVDGQLTLVDLKTCKALYGNTDEKWSQVAGYAILALENGHKITATPRILRIGREESEGFDYVEMPVPALQRERFLKCLELYRIQKRLEGRPE